jgi:DegV family protein with EDD domain
MKKYAWITDSSVCLTEDLQANEDFHYVPLSIILDQQVYRDTVDLSDYELYRELEVAKDPPTTSQPPVGEFNELYRRLKEEYEEVFLIHISDALSGTFSTSVQAARSVQLPHEAVDSKMLSLPLTEIIRRGIKLEKEGKTTKKIAATLQELADSSETYVLVGSLEQLKRSGRINQIQYYLGTLIKLIPIITIRDGKLSIFDKKRTVQKAKNVILSQLQNAITKGTVKKVFLMHGNALEKAEEYKEEIIRGNPDLVVEIGTLCAAIGVHAGEGTVAVSWFNEK